jgi:ABC-type phosphate transport system substrate-binding protein
MGRLISLVMMLLAVAGLLVAGLPQGTTAPDSPAGASQGGPTTEPLAIVVNRSNPVDSLSTPELRRVFLGERSHWPNDRRITIVMRPPGEPERKTMLRDVYQMDEGALKNHFLRGLFTGEILVSPKILSSAVGVKKFVFNVPGAIGYMRLSDVDGTVKVLRIDELLPEDKKYRLHVEVRPPS